MNDTIKNIKNKSKRFFSLLIILFLLIAILPRTIVIIPAGHTGVYQLFGKVTDKEMPSGFHLINPFGNVIKMNIRTQDYTMSMISGEGRRTGSDTITAITKEGLTVGLDITVLFHITEEKASDIYKNVGMNYDEVIIRPAIRSIIREVIANYDTKDIYSDKRKEATEKINQTLKQQLTDRGIKIEQVLLRDVMLPEKLSASIQEKLSAEQEAQKYDFILQTEKKEAERKIIEAKGQRDSQKIINESLTPSYLQYLYIKDLKDRKGTIYVPINPSSGMPMFKGL